MYEKILNEIVIVRLKEPNHAGRDSFSARFTDYSNGKLEFENKNGVFWVVDEQSIDSVIALRNRR